MLSCSTPVILTLTHELDRAILKMYLHTSGITAMLAECRTCDQEVVGSSLGQARGVKTLGKFLIPMCLCYEAV